MDIAQVAKVTGMPASTLRYYEKKGLIASSGRQGLRRTFGKHVLDQLALISLGQSAGFSLDDIRSMLLSNSQAEGKPHGQPQIDRQILAAKADEIDALVKRLQAMSEGLRHAAACPAPSHAECPKFQRLLKAAASGAIERRWKHVEVPKLTGH